MIDQEVFDKVARHLLTQKKKSRIPNYGLCAYRGEGGLKCAIGCLIPDEKYHFYMEGESVWFNTRVGIVLKELGITNFDLCRSLQHIHDQQNPDKWRYCLKIIASSRQLDTSVLKEFP